MVSLNDDAPVATHQLNNLEQDATTASDGCSNSGPRYAELRERAKPENETWPEHDVHEVREPQNSHRDCGIAGASKDCVDHVQHDDDNIAAQHDPCVRRADLE